MRVFNQWKAVNSGIWSFVPFSVFKTEDFWGVCIFGILFEFPITTLARAIHSDLGRS